MNNNTIKIATSDAEIISCFDVMVQLRPHLKETEFLTTVRTLETEGFKLAYMQNNGSVVAVAGYRIYSNLFMGKHMYIDDLVTDKNVRSKGFGKKMVTWLSKLAKQNNCHYVHLDSGTHRHQAHRFYLNQGFDIVSFHFSKKLECESS